jgi:peptidoglycan/LPS O-acetylase OafA/YrhL
VAALDGLRGLAATVVVIEHSFDAVAMPLPVRQLLIQSPLAPLFNAQGAVGLFFVLSGWVLASSLARSGERAPWLLFYVRRVMRIHPPYVAGVLLAWLASFSFLAFVPGQGLTGWLDQWAAVHLTPAQLLASLAFPGPAGNQLSVGWTLRVEMIFSFLMPLLVLAARPGRGLLLLAISAALLALPVRWSDGWYAIDFALGVVLYHERAAVGAALRRVPVAALVLAGLLLLSLPFLLGWWRPMAGVIVGGFARRDIAVMGVGAALLVAAAVARPELGRLLGRPPLRFLGRVSFSLYLVHLTVITWLAPRLVVRGGLVSALGLLVVVLGVSLVLSVLGYRYVERPSIALGNRMTRWLAPRIGARAHPSHAGEVAS